MTQERFYELVPADPDRVQAVPDDVLLEIVTDQGTCMWLKESPDEPDCDLSEAEFAERLCATCPVSGACLELELRQSAGRPLGVWAGMTEDDSHALGRVRFRQHDHEDGDTQS
jgi:WhiB family redox-sensing transcriptional regulator